jgi:hypothetical protein
MRTYFKLVLRYYQITSVNMFFFVVPSEKEKKKRFFYFGISGKQNKQAWSDL